MFLTIHVNCPLLGVDLGSGLDLARKVVADVDIDARASSLDWVCKQAGRGRLLQSIDLLLSLRADLPTSSKMNSPIIQLEITWLHPDA